MSEKEHTYSLAALRGNMENEAHTQFCGVLNIQIAELFQIKPL